MTILFDTTTIKQTLQTHLKQATHSIEIAMAWFTDTDLAAALRAVVLVVAIKILKSSRRFIFQYRKGENQTLVTEVWDYV